MATYSYADLRRLSKEDLMREYDRIALTTQIDLRFIREEIARRDFEEQNQGIRKMTHRIQVLTTIITGLTLVNVAAVVWGVWFT